LNPPLPPIPPPPKRLFIACVALGSNLGDRLDTLQRAAAAIAARVGVIEAQSAVYETPPMYITDQPPFLNAALRVRTALTPRTLLEALLSIERDLGRDREGAHGQRFGPRPIDLDLLLVEGEVDTTPSLQLPHPRMVERRFVLAPLAEVAPNWLHPTLGRNVRDLLASCPDPSPVTALCGAALYRAPTSAQ
jgi:2-amino-4-hydroxy-6-hydroxymethyldihydropteridine diphosphokinase